MGQTTQGHCDHGSRNGLRAVGPFITTMLLVSNGRKSSRTCMSHICTANFYLQGLLAIRHMSCHTIHEMAMPMIWRKVCKRLDEVDM